VEFSSETNADAFLVDEMERVRQTIGAAAGRVNVTGDVQLHHLFIERIPEPVAERRRLYAAGFTRIRIQQASHEPAFLDALLQIGNHRLGTDTRTLRQAADTAKRLREELHLPLDDVVGLLREPGDQLGVLAVHHLIRAGRDDLHVGARLFELVQVGRAAEHGSIQRFHDVVIGCSDGTAAMRAPMRQNIRLVRV